MTKRSYKAIRNKRANRARRRDGKHLRDICTCGAVVASKIPRGHTHEDPDKQMVQGVNCPRCFAFHIFSSDPKTPHIETIFRFFDIQRFHKLMHTLDAAGALHLADVNRPMIGGNQDGKEEEGTNAGGAAVQS